MNSCRKWTPLRLRLASVTVTLSARPCHSAQRRAGQKGPDPKRSNALADTPALSPGWLSTKERCAFGPLFVEGWAFSTILRLADSAHRAQKRRQAERQPIRAVIVRYSPWGENDGTADRTLPESLRRKALPGYPPEMARRPDPAPRHDIGHRLSRHARTIFKVPRRTAIRLLREFGGPAAPFCSTARSSFDSWRSGPRRQSRSPARCAASTAKPRRVRFPDVRTLAPPRRRSARRDPHPARLLCGRKRRPRRSLRPALGLSRNLPGRSRGRRSPSRRERA